jgi:hypothetical protein
MLSVVSKYLLKFFSEVESVQELADWGSIPGRYRNFSLHHHIQTGTGVHPASY